MTSICYRNSKTFTYDSSPYLAMYHMGDAGFKPDTRCRLAGAFIRIRLPAAE